MDRRGIIASRCHSEEANTEVDPLPRTNLPTKNLSIDPHGVSPDNKWPPAKSHISGVNYLSTFNNPPAAFYRAQIPAHGTNILIFRF